VIERGAATEANRFLLMLEVWPSPDASNIQRHFSSCQGHHGCISPFDSIESINATRVPLEALLHRGPERACRYAVQYPSYAPPFTNHGTCAVCPRYLRSLAHGRFLVLLSRFQGRTIGGSRTMSYTNIRKLPMPEADVTAQKNWIGKSGVSPLAVPLCRGNLLDSTIN